MKAVVLVGGFGTRLRPLTATRPKQMLPVANRSMIDRVLEHLGHHGVRTAVLSLGYKPDAFLEAYPDGRCGDVELHYAVEPQPLDTAGAIRFAALHAGIDERFVVVNGDVLTDLDIGSLVAAHEKAGAEGTIALHRVEDPSAFGVVPTDADGRVTAFIEKPPRDEAPTDLINAGTYVLEPSVLARIAPDVPVNVERVTFPAMVADGTLHALDGDTYWIDAGIPSTYLRANLDLIDGTRGAVEGAVAPSAVADGRIERSILGAGAVVEAGATVTGSVLLPGAVVRAGATVTDSVLGAGAEVRSGAIVAAGSVVGDDAVVPSNHQMQGERLPAES
jgi:mannose-1-phosphate guanylyltransferase